MMSKILLLCIFTSSLHAASMKPLVSIITSVYNGELFIEGFLKNIVAIDIFDRCELILINAHSPGEEEKAILPYLQRYPNIIYVKLGYDPGVYAVWNMAIRIANADFITNANLDDRRNPHSLSAQLEVLVKSPQVDMIYSDYYITQLPNDIWKLEQGSWQRGCMPDFSLDILHLCIEGPHPLWRKSIHTKYGYFNEDFMVSGDLEMWNRAASKGSVFLKVPGISGLYYENPNGISTAITPEKAIKLKEEKAYLVDTYRSMWKK